MFPKRAKGNIRHTADESAGVDEDAAVDPRELREVVVTDSTPLLRQSLPAFKTLRCNGHSLNAPVAPELIRVEDVERFLGLGDAKGTLELEEVLLQGR